MIYVINSFTDVVCLVKTVKLIVEKSSYHTFENIMGCMSEI